LLTVLMENPNFLILDEPTNDLDIVTLNVLESYLMDFPGCLIIVSHDRYFMDKLVDHLFVLEGNGEIKDFNGNYTEFRSKQKAALRNQPAAPIDEKVAEKKEKQKASFEQRKAYNRVMKEIEKLEAKKARITESFNNPDLTPEQITDLSKELADVKNLIEEKEELWMELAEIVED